MQWVMSEDEMMCGEWIRHVSTQSVWIKCCHHLACKNDAEVAALLENKHSQDKKIEVTLPVWPAGLLPTHC